MSLVLDRVSYKRNQAFKLVDVDIELKNGNIGCLFGQTGCGKSTLLRLISGFGSLDSGRIFIADKLVSGERVFLPPELRNIGVVFQHPSLFPHKTVFENVAFGVKALARCREKVEEVLEKLGILRLRNEFPESLSGGEQQLVTVARAVICEPRLLLLDEPFSNLDLALRRKMLKELVVFLRESSITTLFVTHDPEEALDFSDKIFCLRAGEIVQKGSPRDVYYNPRDVNLASFFGLVNCINGAVNSNCLECPLGKIYDERVNKKQSLCVRPEAIVLAEDGVKATVQDVKFYNQMILIKIGNSIYWMRFPATELPVIGEEITVRLDLSRAMFLNSI